MVIFVAELGDKSQLMALAFATRYRALTVVAGIAVGAALVQGVSVAVGTVLRSALPTGPITVASGVVFLGFAVWTWRGNDDDQDDRRGGGGRSAVLTVAAAFVVAELGDKTMLATITLATTGGALATWLGATAGTVAADSVAIVVGRQLGSRLPRRTVRRVAAGAFAVFGVVLVVEGLRA